MPARVSARPFPSPMPRNRAMLLAGLAGYCVAKHAKEIGEGASK